MFRTQTTVLTFFTSPLQLSKPSIFSHVFPSIFDLISMKSASNVWYMFVFSGKTQWNSATHRLLRQVQKVPADDMDALLAAAEAAGATAMAEVATFFGAFLFFQFFLKFGDVNVKSCSSKWQL